MNCRNTACSAPLAGLLQALPHHFYSSLAVLLIGAAECALTAAPVPGSHAAFAIASPLLWQLPCPPGSGLCSGRAGAPAVGSVSPAWELQLCWAGCPPAPSTLWWSQSLYHCEKEGISPALRGSDSTQEFNRAQKGGWHLYRVLTHTQLQGTRWHLFSNLAKGNSPVIKEYQVTQIWHLTPLCLSSNFLPGKESPLISQRLLKEQIATSGHQLLAHWLISGKVALLYPVFKTQHEENTKPSLCLLFMRMMYVNL